MSFMFVVENQPLDFLKHDVKWKISRQNIYPPSVEFIANKHTW